MTVVFGLAAVTCCRTIPPGRLAIGFRAVPVITGLR